MTLDATKEYRELYERMFNAVQSGNHPTADHLRREMEHLRQNHISASNSIPSLNDGIPAFVRKSLGKNPLELGHTEPSNCINAAFNFHAEFPRYLPFSTMEFLAVAQNQYRQLDDRHSLRSGDLVAMWSRTSNEWANRKIQLNELMPSAPGFPFGLVFDHVAVFLEDDLLFHKPDPTLESRYQINRWGDVISFNEVIPGFELTFHRLKKPV